MKCVREQAYHALKRAFAGEGYLKDFLEGAPPLAVEIACGVMRQKLLLDNHLRTLMPKSGLKKKERILLWMALYQRYFLDSIPDYAIVNETVSLAKKTCHASFVPFCNAILRKLPETIDKTTLSYPDYLLERIEAKYLHLMNEAPSHFARQRHQNAYIRITNPKTYADDPRYYIQNPTPWELLVTGADFQPKTILDLCAAPGGKALALQDIYPKARITCNDINEKRLEKLHENLKKYQIDCKTIVSDGTQFTSAEKYDLIVIDAPCSNSGVLGKRPESRWRASKESIEELNKLQRELIMRSKEFLNPGGEIWYMTCSILPEENENLVATIPMQCKTMRTIYPDDHGHDGGFIACLQEDCLIQDIYKKVD